MNFYLNNIYVLNKMKVLQKDADELNVKEGDVFYIKCNINGFGNLVLVQIKDFQKNLKYLIH